MVKYVIFSVTFGLARIGFKLVPYLEIYPSFGCLDDSLVHFLDGFTRSSQFLVDSGHNISCD